MALCCINCFLYDYLKDYINKHGEEADCEYCGEMDVMCIEDSELKELFEPVISLYNPIDISELDKEPTGKVGLSLWERLQSDWELFESDDEEQQKKLLIGIIDPKEDISELQYSGFTIPKGFYSHKPGFLIIEIEYLWEEFREEIINTNRYFPEKTLKLDYIEKTLPQLENEIIPFPTKGLRQDLYRVRRSGWDPLPCEEMGKPPIKSSRHGRANPKGISYLNLASDKETALEKKRESIGQYATIATFNPKYTLKIINLNRPSVTTPFGLEEDTEEIIEYSQILFKIGEELSKPVKPGKEELEYIPLQYVCEFIKKQGYDGMTYKSSKGPGFNIAIFNDEKLICKETELYELQPRPFRKVE